MSRKKKYNAKYSPKYKISVIIDTRENGLAGSINTRCKIFT